MDHRRRRRTMDHRRRRNHHFRCRLQYGSDQTDDVGGKSHTVIIMVTAVVSVMRSCHGGKCACCRKDDSESDLCELHFSFLSFFAA